MALANGLSSRSVVAVERMLSVVDNSSVTKKMRPTAHPKASNYALTVDFSEHQRVCAMMLNFPEELLWKILGILPISNLLYFRSVCKRWNSFVKDPQFQKVWANIHGGEQFIFYTDFMKFVSTKKRNYFTTVFDGLLHLNDGNDRYVVDPTSAYLRKIPSLPCDSTHNSWYYERYIGMMVCQGTKDYSIFVAYLRVPSWATSSTKEPATIYQYDSIKDAWHLACIFPCKSLGWHRILRGVVIHRGSLHCLITYQNRWKLQLCCFQVVRYDQEHNHWEHVSDRFPSLLFFNESRPLLFVHNAKLYVAAFFVGRYVIWQYQDEEAQWRFFDFLSKDFTGTGLKMSSRAKQQISFHAQSCGDFLYVAKRQSVNDEMIIPSVMIYNLGLSSTRRCHLMKWNRSRCGTRKLELFSSQDNRIIPLYSRQFESLHALELE